MSKLRWTYLCILLGPSLWAQEGPLKNYTIQGFFTGKNLYIQNVFHKKAGLFCVVGVYVNKKIVIERPKISALEVSLAELPKYSKVEVSILHRPSCVPRVLNPEVLSLTKSSAFKYISVQENKIIWTMESEAQSASYAIEFLNGDQWETEATLTGHAQDLSTYTYTPTTFSPGGNKFRVKYVSKTQELYSSPVEILLEEKVITFTPEIVIDKMRLSERAYFEILDETQQHVLLEGELQEIPLRLLASGNYFIVLEGKIYPFVKK